MAAIEVDRPVAEQVFVDRSVRNHGAPGVLAGEFDYDLGGRPGAPRRSLAQKAGALLLSLVLRPKPAREAPPRNQEPGATRGT